MKRFISALALVTLGFYGCSGDDDDDADNTAGTGGTSSNAGQPSGEGGEATGTGGMPAAGGDGTGPTGGAASGNVMCDPTADGVCQNAMDCPFVASGEARLTAGQCGLDCLQSMGDETCPGPCVVETIDISEECGTCYGDAVWCSIMNCAGVCAAAPEGDPCKECQVEKGCRQAFNECSGLPE